MRRLRSVGDCSKARLLLALLERPYERVPIDIFAGDTLTPEYAATNPARETPVLELTDESGPFGFKPPVFARLGWNSYGTQGAQPLANVRLSSRGKMA